MTSDQTQKYRAIGGQLALYLRRRVGPWPTSSVLQGIAADLVGDHAELSLALREMVSRPAFRALAEQAGSGRGLLERDALLQDLKSTFAPPVVAGLAEVLNGLLDLPSGSHSPCIPSQPVREKRSATPPGGSPRTEGEQRPSRISQSRLSLVLLMGLAAAAVAAASVVMLRTSRLCGALGLCPQAVGISTRSSALQAASAADQALRRASSVEAYAGALELLEQELLKLSANPLSQEQQRQLSALQANARDARQTLSAERAAQDALARAADAIAAAKATTASGQTPQLIAARQALDPISQTSFLGAEASRLRAVLDELIRQAAAASKPRSTDQSTTVRPAPPSARPTSPPRWSPPPTVHQPAPTSSAPYRDQPLF